MLSHLPLLGSLEPIGARDIVVFESRDGSQKRYIKRVVARGPKIHSRRLVNATAEEAETGVRVQFLEGAVFVDRQRVEEPYILPEERRSQDMDDSMLGAGEYYVLGDHRSLSKDSRNFGPIHEDQVIGRALFRFWPLRRIGLLRDAPAS
jgi:signal peptidase I